MHLKSLIDINYNFLAFVLVKLAGIRVCKMLKIIKVILSYCVYNLCKS